VEDTWISYEIHPETPPEGVLLERLFGPGIERMQGGLHRRCAELDLPFVAPRLLSNSRLVIEAAEFARDAARHPEFHRAALAAYFARSQDIGDLEVLEALTAEVGLDPADLQKELAAARYAGTREAAREEARASGVTAVPTFIFPGGSRVVGAQPLDRFRRLLESMNGR
jgi:predicted DsbA family dithiol-disulfide isomerase